MGQGRRWGDRGRKRKKKINGREAPGERGPWRETVQTGRRAGGPANRPRKPDSRRLEPRPGAPPRARRKPALFSLSLSALHFSPPETPPADVAPSGDGDSRGSGLTRRRPERQPNPIGRRPGALRRTET